jgi:hypothetical protein
MDMDEAMRFALTAGIAGNNGDPKAQQKDS